MILHGVERALFALSMIRSLFDFLLQSCEINELDSYSYLPLVCLGQLAVSFTEADVPRCLPSGVAVSVRIRGRSSARPRTLLFRFDLILRDSDA
jgi:hypothetical protein